MNKKVIIIGAVVIAAGAIGGTAYFLNRQDDKDSLPVYVTSVADINTAEDSIYNMQFAGVTMPEKSEDIKPDTEKQIAEVAVSEGDRVKKGDVLFTYDVDAMKLKYEQDKLDIEQTENQIETDRLQIEQLEKEKAKANANDQLTYTTQIGSLEASIAKSEYDVKSKKIKLKDLKKSIDDADVVAEFDGTVKAVKSTDQLTTEGDGVLMKLISDDKLKIIGTANEQNMQYVNVDEAVIVKSRADDTTYSGVISEVGVSPEEKENNDGMGEETDTSQTPSQYSFYVTLDEKVPFILGQHVLIIPGGETEKKEGIWIASDYIQTDEDGKTFVWAENSRSRLEKKYVTTGDVDEDMMETQIKDGLTEKDMIAFPSGDFKAGMKTTHNMEEAEPDNSDSGEEFGEDGDNVGEEDVMGDEDGGSDEEADSDGAADTDEADEEIDDAT